MFGRPCSFRRHVDKILGSTGFSLDWAEFILGRIFCRRGRLLSTLLKWFSIVAGLLLSGRGYLRRFLPFSIFANTNTAQRLPYYCISSLLNLVLTNSLALLELVFFVLLRFTRMLLFVRLADLLLLLSFVSSLFMLHNFLHTLDELLLLMLI